MSETFYGQGCCYTRPLSKREEQIRKYNLAKQIYERLIGGNYNRMEIELDKNLVCQIDAMGTIVYKFAKGKKRLDASV